MTLRPGRTIRKIKRPYTRVSRKKPRKSYVVGVPYLKIHIFEIGKKSEKYNTVLYLVSEEDAQIRDCALEASRIVAVKHLAKKLGEEGFFMKVLVYPHQVLREHSIAMGAGADRYSQGMAHAFGHPSGIAVRSRTGQTLIQLNVKESDLKLAKEALKMAASKVSTKTRIELKK